MQEPAGKLRTGKRAVQQRPEERGGRIAEPRQHPGGRTGQTAEQIHLPAEPTTAQVLHGRDSGHVVQEGQTDRQLDS